MDAVSDCAILGQGPTETEWNSWPGLSRTTTAAALVPRGARALVIAPHPDDEVLTVGGLLAQLARIGTPEQVVAVTDGTTSHPGSSVWPAERLAVERAHESREALRCLGIE